tara:strand:+ start:122 stop:1060 length:939 start_codon:yes stop_codon:yes gene_type:complete
MKRGKLFGGILVLIGIIMIINSQTSILGAVIGFKEITTNASLIGGLVFIIIGTGLFISSREEIISRLEKTVELTSRRNNVRDMETYINTIYKEEEPDILVVDTNIFLDYTLEGINEFFDRFDGQIYVPDEILNEIYRPGRKPQKGETSEDREKRKNKRDIVEARRKTDDGLEEYRKLSNDVLNETSKSLFYRERILGENIEHEFPNRIKAEFDHYERIIQERLDKEGLQDNERNRRKVARDFKVTKGDADVLAMAIYGANKNQDVIVSSRDKDLKEAVEILRGNEEEYDFGKNLFYVPDNEAYSNKVIGSRM